MGEGEDPLKIGKPPPGLPQDVSSAQKTPTKKQGIFSRFFSTKAKNPDITKQSTSIFDRFGEWYRERKHKISSEKITASKVTTSVSSDKANTSSRIFSCFRRGSRAEPSSHKSISQSVEKDKVVIEGSARMQKQANQMVNHLAKQKPIELDRDKIEKTLNGADIFLSGLIQTEHGRMALKAFATSSSSAKYYNLPLALRDMRSCIAQSDKVLKEKCKEFQDRFIQRVGFEQITSTKSGVSSEKIDLPGVDLGIFDQIAEANPITPKLRKEFENDLRIIEKEALKDLYSGFCKSKEFEALAALYQVQISGQY